MQHDEPLMRFIRDDFVWRDDAVACPHDVFAGIDAATKLVAAPHRLRVVGNQGRAEELPYQFQVQDVADARPGIRMQLFGATQVLREREHLIARHR